MEWDGTSMNCFGMGWDGTEKYVPRTSLVFTSTYECMNLKRSKFKSELNELDTFSSLHVFLYFWKAGRVHQYLYV